METVEQKLIAPKKAAEICGVTTRTLANWEKSGKIGCTFTAGGQRSIREMIYTRLSGETLKKPA